MKICVLTHFVAAGMRPRAFLLGGRRVAVAAVLHRWEDAGQQYFRVVDFDGRSFVLRHSPSLGCWDLAGVRAPARRPGRVAA